MSVLSTRVFIIEPNAHYSHLNFSKQRIQSFGVQALPARSELDFLRITTPKHFLVVVKIQMILYKCRDAINRVSTNVVIYHYPFF
jgi:hypothetical protein